MNRSRLFLSPDLTSPLLHVIATINMLLFIAFILILLSAGNAHADDTTCRGQDLIAEWTKSDPAKVEAIRAEAAKTPNGNALLWTIEKDGVKPSWLFGTMHMADPRVVNLTDAAQSAYDQADTVTIETTEVLDPSAAIKAMAERPDLMMFTDDTTLEKLLPADKQDMVRQALSARGIPLSSVRKMKPWMISAMVALPACEMARKKSGAAFLDLKLAANAEADGKALEGLETIVEQLDAMASLPLQFHIDGLLETLTLESKLDDIFETMITLYSKGEIAMIVPMLRAVSPDSTLGGDSYGDFEEAMVKARNRTMAERAGSILDKGNAFIAVGALHLPGEEGLIELLRARGYTVTAAH